MNEIAIQTDKCYHTVFSYFFFVLFLFFVVVVVFDTEIIDFLHNISHNNKVSSITHI